MLSSQILLAGLHWQKVLCILMSQSKDLCHQVQFLTDTSEKYYGLSANPQDEKMVYLIIVGPAGY